MIHGGDIYRNKVELDYSVNVNPLGIPEGVKQALQEAVICCDGYPDIRWQSLSEQMSKALSVSKEVLLWGNGASELFAAIVHGLKPQKVVLPIPSFYGYEYASRMGNAEMVYYPCREEAAFLPGEELLSYLTEDVDMLMIANPNNPTGTLLDRAYVRRLLQHCLNREITVVLDECFIEFCEGEHSMVAEIQDFSNLIIVRAFTKLYAIPGVRLGYLVCANQELRETVRRQLPEWNVSILAQAAGLACMQERDYVRESMRCVRNERTFLISQLEAMGIKVYAGAANYLLIRSEQRLYEELLKKGILIRDCSNFQGLQEGYYRIAVKTRQENERLVEALKEICQAK